MPRSCGTCRRRRRACDRQRPACTTCRDSGHLCEGYDAYVFVNVKQPSSTGAIPRHSSPGKSHGGSRCSKTVPQLTHDAEQLRIVRVLDMSEAEFQSHRSVLMRQFALEHGQTPRAWSIHLDKLSGQSFCFDTACIALSTLRLSQAADDSNLQIMSLTAYDCSTRMFRQYCDHARLDERTLPTLAMVSLVHCLYEFAQETPDTILDSSILDCNLHLTGLAYFLQRSGPLPYRRGGLHDAFLKAREILLLSSLSRRQRSFLCESIWMTVPWSDRPKTTRDELWDIVAEVVDLQTNRGQLRSQRIPELQCQLRQVQERFNPHLSSWHHTDLATSTNPDEMDSVMISLECLVVELLLQLTSLEAQYLTATNVVEASTLAEKIGGILRLPPFGTSRAQKSGIVEADCRSLLAIYVLRQYGIWRSS